MTPGADPQSCRMRQVVVYPGEDGYWVAKCPSQPGCIGQGRMKQQAIVDIKEAIEGGYAPALKDDGQPVPEKPAVPM